MTTSFAANPNRAEDATPKCAAPNADSVPEPTTATSLTPLLAQLQTQTDPGFSHDKTSTLLRRIGRRMAVNE